MALNNSMQSNRTEISHKSQTKFARSAKVGYDPLQPKANHRQTDSSVDSINQLTKFLKLRL